jgi:hypothetical protein
MKFDEFWTQLTESLAMPMEFRTLKKNKKFIVWYYPGLYDFPTYDGFGNRDPDQYGVILIWAGKGLEKAAPKAGQPYNGIPEKRDGSWLSLKRQFESVWKRMKPLPWDQRWWPDQYQIDDLSNCLVLTYMVALIHHYAGQKRIE